MHHDIASSTVVALCFPIPIDPGFSSSTTPLDPYGRGHFFQAPEASTYLTTSEGITDHGET